MDLLASHFVSRALLNGLPEEFQLTLWCQKIWTDAMVVHPGVVLCDVVPFVRWSRLPVILELLLQFSATEPVEVRFHCFGVFWLDGVGEDTQRCYVISLHGRRGLWMPHLLERVTGGWLLVS